MLSSSLRRHGLSAFVLLLAFCTMLGAGDEASFNPNEFEWEDRPIPFLSKSKNLSEIVLEPEGLEFLRKIKSPVSIVTFIGMSRSGKSFSLNHLLGIDQHKGFKVGHTITPETRGAEIWGRPINARFMRSKQNRTSVLVLDTEGLGASLSNYDKSILFFSVLMSSRVIYHLNENINNDDITRLYSIINLVEMFKKEKIPTVNLPYISWVVQRFTLGLPQGYTPLDVLFEKKLVELPNPGNDDGISHFNETVRVVRSEFKEHSVFFIPPASKNVDDYIVINIFTYFSIICYLFLFQRLPDMKLSELNPQYLIKMSELRDLITSTRPKLLGNTDEEMTGETLANFITGLIPEVNKGTFYVGDRVLEGIAKGLLEKCKREYARKVRNAVLPMDISELEAHNTAAKEAAERCFDNGMVGRSDSYVKALYKGMLEEENLLTFEFLRDNNTYQSMSLCVNVTKTMTDRALKSERVGDAHNSYVDSVVKEASELLRGPKKATCLEELRTSIDEILNNKKISLIPSRVDTLIKNIIAAVGVLYAIKSFTNFRTLELIIWPFGVLGVMLGLYKFNFFSILTREHVITILDTYDELYFIITTYWQVAPLILIFILLFIYSFEPKNPYKVVTVLKERMAKNKNDNEDIYVEFWRNCTNDENKLKEVVRRLAKIDKPVLLIGWKHKFGLGFLPRSNLAHVLCAGKSDDEEFIKKALDAAIEVITGNEIDDISEDVGSGRCVVYKFNVETSVSTFSSDNDIKKEIINSI